MRKIITLLFVCALSLGILAGCVPALAAPVADGDIKVGFVIRTVGNPYYAAMATGVREAAEKRGWGFMLVDAANDSAVELEGMETMVAAGVNLIFLNCVDPFAATESMRVAYDAGIPVINLDSGVDDKTMQVATVYSDNIQNGIGVGKYFAEHFDREKTISSIMVSGNIGSIAGGERRNGLWTGIIMGRTGLSESDAWDAAMKMEAELVATGKARNEAADFYISGQGWGDWTVDGGLLAAEDLITANPAVNMIMGENCFMVLGGAIALDNAGITYGDGGVVSIIAAADGSLMSYDAIKAGRMLAVGENSPHKVGAMGVKVAAEILEEGRDAKSFPEVIMTPPAVISAANVDEFYPYGF